ncbi:MAG: hypothetical protein V9G22_04945 [Ottowia sp.]
MFSLSSGPNRGPILLELKTDRRDNDVSNGIQDEVRHLLVVWAVEGVASTPLSLAAVSFDVPNATPFGVVLSATGGRAPYSWTALDALPTGLSLSDAGVSAGHAARAAGHLCGARARLRRPGQRGRRDGDTEDHRPHGAAPGVHRLGDHGRT